MSTSTLTNTTLEENQIKELPANTNKILEEFLTENKIDKKSTTFFLENGVRLSGIIVDFDTTHIKLKPNNTLQDNYSIILSIRQISTFTNKESSNTNDNMRPC